MWSRGHSSASRHFLTVAPRGNDTTSVEDTGRACQERLRPCGSMEMNFNAQLARAALNGGVRAPAQPQCDLRHAPVSSSADACWIRDQTNKPISIPTTQAAMVHVEAQPSQRSHPLMMNFPMIFDCAVINIMTVMIGTAMMPLITAVQ